jgi:hypothetical protein
MSSDAPAGDGISDNEYKSRTGQSEIPVVGDNSAVEGGVDPATEDSDATLGMLTLTLNKCDTDLANHRTR